MENKKVKDLLQKMKLLRKKISKKSKTVNLTQSVIDARYKEN